MAVDRLIDADEVAVCGPIVCEIRRGLRSRSERFRVLSLLEGCHHLVQPTNLWEEAGELGAQLGRRGATVKTLDLLIATFAIAHGVPILTGDSDFTLMRRAGVHLTVLER